MNTFTVVATFDASGETYQADGLALDEAIRTVVSLGGQSREPWGLWHAEHLVLKAEHDDVTGEATVVLTGKSGKPITITVTAEDESIDPFDPLDSSEALAE